MSGDEAGALDRLKRFLNKSPRIIHEKIQRRFLFGAPSVAGLPARTVDGYFDLIGPRWAIEHNWVSITPLRLDLTDEKDLARALSLSQSLPVSAKKR
jgi:hypothetical protein